MVWPALIGAGASLIGSLFGGGSKKTTTTSRVDYKRMVRDAEAAGFNPLTALRNGGAAGFSVSTSTTPAAPLSARLADGVAGGVNAFLQNFDPHADSQREERSRLIEAQVNNLNASTAELTQRHAVTGRGSAALSGKAAVTSVMLDGYRYGGSGEGGVIEDMWVVYRSPDGTYKRVPNPNLPDGEQLLVPPAAELENAITRPVLADLGRKDHFSFRKMTADEKKADQAWRDRYSLPGWVPSIEFNWN